VYLAAGFGTWITTYTYSPGDLSLVRGSCTTYVYDPQSGPGDGSDDLAGPVIGA
jgi:hypothetical protein